jgi:hypothetical protein
LLQLGLVDVRHGTVFFLSSLTYSRKKRHLPFEFDLAALGAKRSLVRVDRGREEVENHVAFLAVELIDGHGNSSGTNLHVLVRSPKRSFSVIPAQVPRQARDPELVERAGIQHS